jgi:hypothetical protein
MLTFRHALEAADIDPKSVCVLRHQDTQADPGRNPYHEYQAVQAIGNCMKLNATYWASFVGTPGRETMFCGLYACRYVGVGETDVPKPERRGELNRAGHYDRYELLRQPTLDGDSGLMFIEWGDGWRTWIQRNTDKPIVELHRRYQESRYPGQVAAQQLQSRKIRAIRPLSVAGGGAALRID